MPSNSTIELGSVTVNVTAALFECPWATLWTTVTGFVEVIFVIILVSTGMGFTGNGP